MNAPDLRTYKANYPQILAPICCAFNPPFSLGHQALQPVSHVHAIMHAARLQLPLSFLDLLLPVAHSNLPTPMCSSIPCAHSPFFPHIFAFKPPMGTRPSLPSCTPQRNLSLLLLLPSVAQSNVPTFLCSSLPWAHSPLLLQTHAPIHRPSVTLPPNTDTIAQPCHMFGAISSPGPSTELFQTNHRILP